MNLFAMIFQSDLLLWNLHREALHCLPINPFKGQPWQLEYSHQKKNNFFTSIFYIHLCILRVNSHTEWINLCLPVLYSCYITGSISKVVSKPIKPLWLVSGFQRIIGHNWPLPLILHLQYQIGHHWSCSTNLDLVLELVSTSLRYHRKVLTQVPAVDVHPVFLLSSSCSR